jgi:hypothetical protein
MRKSPLVLASAIALIAAANLAAAQGSADQAKQPAPPQSGEASGQDAQAGRPETAASPGSAGSAGQKTDNTGEANARFTEEAKKQKK